MSTFDTRPVDMSRVQLLRIVLTPSEAAELEWQDRALCAETDPEAFFPDKGGSTAAAKRVCAQCEVREPCLDYALEHDERFGIWGGLSERERRHLRRPQQRRTCASGLHSWTEENIYVSPDGVRACRPCRTASDRRTRTAVSSATSLPDPQPRERAA